MLILSRDVLSRATYQTKIKFLEPKGNGENMTQYSKPFAASDSAVIAVPEGAWAWALRNDGPDTVSFGDSEVTFATGTEIAVNEWRGLRRPDVETVPSAVYIVCDTGKHASVRAITDV